MPEGSYLRQKVYKYKLGKGVGREEIIPRVKDAEDVGWVPALPLYSLGCCCCIMRKFRTHFSVGA